MADCQLLNSVMRFVMLQAPTYVSSCGYKLYAQSFRLGSGGAGNQDSAASAGTPGLLLFNASGVTETDLRREPTNQARSL
jgi:hypothetical protein